MSEQLHINLDSVDISVTSEHALVCLHLDGDVDYLSVTTAIEEFMRSANWHANYQAKRRAEERARREQAAAATESEASE